MKKRILSLLLAVLMVVAMVPMSATATDASPEPTVEPTVEPTTEPTEEPSTPPQEPATVSTFAELKAFVESEGGGQVKLNENIVIDEDFDLSLNDKTIETDGNALVIKSGTTTVSGGTIENNKTVSNIRTEARQLFVIEEKGTLHINDGVLKTVAHEPIRIIGGKCIIENAAITCTAEDTKSLDGAAMVTVEENGQFTMKNGTITANKTSDISCGMYGIYALSNAQVTLGVEGATAGPKIDTVFAPIGQNATTAPATWNIYGGTYKVNVKPANNESPWWKYFCGAIYASGKSNMTIYGGNFQGTSYSVIVPWKDAGTQIKILGGNFTASESAFLRRDNTASTYDEGINSVSISGGTFNKEISAESIATGFAAKKSGDVWNVEPVVKDGGLVVTEPTTSTEGGVTTASKEVGGTYVPNKSVTVVDEDGKPVEDPETPGDDEVKNDKFTIDVVTKAEEGQEPTPASQTTVTIPAVTAQSFSQNNEGVDVAPEIELKTDVGTVTIPSEAVEEMAAAAETATQITIEVKETKPGEGTETTEVATYDVDVKANDENILTKDSYVGRELILTVPMPEDAEFEDLSAYLIETFEGTGVATDEVIIRPSGSSMINLYLPHLSTYRLFAGELPEDQKTISPEAKAARDAVAKLMAYVDEENALIVDTNEKRAAMYTAVIDLGKLTGKETPANGDTQIATELATALASIEKIDLSAYDGVEPIPDVGVLAPFTGVKDLSIAYQDQVTNLGALVSWTALETIDVSGTSLDKGKTSDYDGLAALENKTTLKTVIANDCVDLHDLDGLSGCTALEEVYVNGCSKLVDFNGLKNRTSLKRLEANGCTTIPDLHGLEGCTGLKVLYVGGCTGIGDDDFSKVTGISLEELDVSCTNVTSLDQLLISGSSLTTAGSSLKKLYAYDLNEPITSLDGILKLAGKDPQPEIVMWGSEISSDVLGLQAKLDALKEAYEDSVVNFGPPRGLYRNLTLDPAKGTIDGLAEPGETITIPVEIEEAGGNYWVWLPTPTRTEYKFLGWYNEDAAKDEDKGPFTDVYTVKADGITLTARWQYVPNNPPVIDNPTPTPTTKPSTPPTTDPTTTPSTAPSQAPSEQPSQAPTEQPTEQPTQAPTQQPTEQPTQAPTQQPTQAPTQAPAKFTDMPTNKDFITAINWAVAEGITKGKTATTFGPNDPCTRAHIVTFLWRAMGKPQAATTATFTDMPTNKDYVSAISWAVEKGVTKGTSGTTFSPDKTCTREEAVTFLWRAYGKAAAAKPATFSDMPTNKDFINAISWAVENNITKGTSVANNTFSPKKNCTRAEIVTFLYRADQK